ncbi:MAG TPA: hypothetical protein VH590_11285 [Ktedonobacterales bacterium]|jgi:hypothetical protein
MSHQEQEPFPPNPPEPLDRAQPPSLLLRVVRWPWKQGLPELIALVEGLALLGLFCFAPWFYWRVLTIIGGLHLTQALRDHYLYLLAPHNFSGWAMAPGISIDDQPSSFFGYLWLIPLLGVALIALAGLHQRRMLSARITLAALLALSLLALLIEGGLYLQVQHFQEMLGDLTGVGVSWGFWSAAGVNAAGIIASILLRRPALPRLRALRSAEGAAG